MPRIARVVFSDIPHHITQRGNRREDVFFTNADRQLYLKSLREYSAKEGLYILAYCLMTNHIHLVASPKTLVSLHRTLKPLHTRYANLINRRFGWKGHFWQGRFFSNPLDEHYMWTAIRYVEQNPVRAKIVKKAQQYPWSSAAAHCGLKKDALLAANVPWDKKMSDPDRWSSWLAAEEEKDSLKILQRNIPKGLPCGDETFIRRLEKLTGKALRFRPQGRPNKQKEYA